MASLDLTHEEIQQILLVGKRFLINESTHPDDLKAVLIQRMSERWPGLARKIGRLGKPQMASLHRTMLAQRELHA